MKETADPFTIFEGKDADGSFGTDWNFMSTGEPFREKCFKNNETISSWKIERKY